MGRLDGKVAVITGGASGIGAGTVRRFVEEGARCVIADIQDDVGRGLAAELGEATVFQHTDVTVEDDIASAVALATDRFGRIDCMFNNAGVLGAVGSITQTSYTAWSETLAILLSSVFLGMKHAGAAMVAQGSGSGSIISTSSTAGILGGHGPHAYTAAKHGVIGLTKSVANELAPHGVRVNAIAPGNTATAMTATLITGDHTDVDGAAARIGHGSLLGYPGLPIDVANAAVYLASDDSRYVTGHTLVIDAGETSVGAVSRFHGMSSGLIGEAGRRR